MATITSRTSGERFVAYGLASLGYVTNIKTKNPDSPDIEARGNARSLLVRVKSAVQPDTPESLSDDEASNLKAQAANLGFEAWEARVQLDPQLNQVGQLGWRKLS